MRAAMKKTREQEPAANEEGEILARLAERVEKAVATIQELRRERDQLTARVADLESRLGDQDDANARIEALQGERGELRDRIESILASLEALEAE